MQCFFVLACYANASWTGYRLRGARELAEWFVHAQQVILDVECAQ